MVKRFRPPLAWLTGLLLASLWLAACGGTAQSTPSSQEQAVANPTTAVTDEVDQADPATEEAATAKTPATAVAAASPTTQSTTASKQADCQAIEIPTNAAVSPASDTDWSKGPADAPITLIEYGDFQ